MWFWADGTPDFYLRQVWYKDYSLYKDLCTYVSIHPPQLFIPVACNEGLHLDWFVWEKRLTPRHTHKIDLQLSDPHNNNKFNNLFKCKQQYFTKSFLACDIQSNCLTTSSKSLCYFKGYDVSVTKRSDEYYSVEMFQCTKGSGTIHYTLVCDFRPDCLDASDEHFCVHPESDKGFRYKKIQTMN